MLAIIKTGGKQYIVKKGDKIRIEKISGKEGDKIDFTEILFVGDATKVKIGTPFVDGAVVKGNILKQTRNKKVWGIKHKAKKRYKLKFGHRQSVTEVEIIEIK